MWRFKDVLVVQMKQSGVPVTDLAASASTVMPASVEGGQDRNHRQFPHRTRTTPVQRL